MEKRLKDGIKYFGIGLLLLAIPGSTFLLPMFFSKKIRDSKKSKEILGI